MLSWNVAVVGQSELGCCAGHSPLLEACLHLIGRRHSTTCPYCNNAEELAEHLVLWVGTVENHNKKW